MGQLFAVLMVLILLGVVVAAVKSSQRTRSAWADAASELGLTPVGSGGFGHPKLTGRIGQIDVLVEIKGSGDNARTQYRINYPALSPNFTLKREGGAQRLLQKFGMSDVEIGDPTFDTAFTIATGDPAAVTRLLTPARRLSLLRLLAVQPRLTIAHDHAEVSTKGIERRAERLVATVRRMVGSAEHLAGKPSTPQLDDATRIRALGDLGAAVQKLEAAVTEYPEDIDLGVLYAETALSAGDIAESRAATQRLSEIIPGDNSVEGVREALDRRADELTASPAEPPAATPPIELLDEIFGSRRLSFETDEIFARDYRGRTVRWLGQVKSARQYTEDLDFGDTPGTKAVITVATIDSDLYGNTEIDAVVALAPGIRLDRGTQVTVEGLLDKVDPMMRNIFIRDGKLVDP